MDDLRDEVLSNLSEMSEDELHARYLQERMKVTYDDGTQADVLNVTYKDGPREAMKQQASQARAQQTTMPDNTTGLRNRRGASANRRDKGDSSANDDSDDDEITEERLEDLRVKVHINTVKERVEWMMNGYYAVLGLLFWGFYRSLKAHGANSTIFYYRASQQYYICSCSNVFRR